MLEILERIVAGEGREGDIEELEELADMIEKHSSLRSWKECAKTGNQHDPGIPGRI